MTQETSTDVYRETEEHVTVRFGTVEYRLPPDTAAAWARSFRDAIDGRERNTPNTPDIDTVEWSDIGRQFVIIVGGDHAEYGDGWHIQQAYVRPGNLDVVVKNIHEVLER